TNDLRNSNRSWCSTYRSNDRHADVRWVGRDNTLPRASNDWVVRNLESCKHPVRVTKNRSGWIDVTYDEAVGDVLVKDLGIDNSTRTTNELVVQLLKGFLTDANIDRNSEP